LYYCIIVYSTVDWLFVKQLHHWQSRLPRQVFKNTLPQGLISLCMRVFLTESAVLYQFSGRESTTFLGWDLSWFWLS